MTSKAKAVAQKLLVVRIAVAKEPRLLFYTAPFYNLALETAAPIAEALLIALEALEFYKAALQDTQVIERVINGGEYIPLGTEASMALERIEKIVGEGK